MEIRPNEGIKPISDFRKDSAHVLRELKRRREPIILTQRGRSVAVLMDVETFERMEYAAHLRASYLRGVDDFKKGRWRKQDDAAREIERWARE